MNDNDIIKALECCRDCNCKECPCYNKETDGCKEIDEQDILDLINRQQEQIKKLENIERFATKTVEKQEKEIEKLNVELVGMRGACESYKMHYDNAQTEIERLKSEVAKYENALIEKTKSETIKEFAKRLKEQAECVDMANWGTVEVLGVEDVDNLVKEMTEVQE